MLRPYKGRNALIVDRRVPDDSFNPGLMPAPEPFTIAWVEWKTDETLIVSIRFAGRRGSIDVTEGRLLAVDRDTMQMTNLFKPKATNSTGARSTGTSRMISLQAQFQDGVIDFLRHDPEHIMVSVDADLDGEDEVRLVQIKNGNYREIGQDFRGIQNWYTDMTGTLRMADGYDRITGDYYLMIRQTASSRWMNFEKTIVAKNNWRPVTFAENPNHLYVHGRNEYGRRTLALYDLAADKILEVFFSDEKYDFGNLLQEERTDKVIGYWYIDDQVQLVYFEEEWRRLQKIIDRALPDTYNRIVSSASNGNLHLILSRSDVESGVYYVYDKLNKRISPVIPRYPDLDPALMSPKQIRTYTARDGLEITGYLTIPLGMDASNLPLVLFPHGGPATRDTLNFDIWSQFLASRGYAVFQPNFRGSSGYGREFQRMGRQSWGHEMQDDLTDAVEWLISEGIADKDMICIAGISYGGYAANMATVKTPDLFKCAIAINALSDLIRLVSDTKRFIGGDAAAESIVAEDASSRELRPYSPYFHIDKITTPILLIHVEDDRVVRFNQSKRFARRLKRGKKEYKFVVIEEGGHSLRTEASRLTAMLEMEAFLAIHLK